MLQAFVITLREGFEAFLIVAISLSYLRKSGRGALASAVHWGTAAAAAVSIGGGYVLFHAANQEWLDGPLAVVAAVSVTWMVVHMWRYGRRMKGDIEGRLRSTGTGAAAFTGVFLFTGLMISREGMETALLLFQLKETIWLAVGALAGIAGAATVAWLWSRYARRINLALFFQCTALFLFVFVVQLVIKGFHEMAEQNFLPWSDIIHARTEAWGPDSAFGHLLSYLLVILPVAWLLLKAAFSRRPVFQREQTPDDRGPDVAGRAQVLGDNQRGVLHAG
ncbi:MAG TPA: FTR1 family protein [Vicinamibacterales bacterium]|nr:FTR1 family protein [Vicinamibacterales bacterium]